MIATELQSFLEQKSQDDSNSGFNPVWQSDQLFDFQQSLVEWAVLKGRAGLFCDCGLGKTFMQLAYAENVARKTDKPVLILSPLAVGAQTVKEAEKLGLEATISRTGKVHRLTVTNYQRLHLFNPNDFAGVVCDESSIIKSFDGTMRADLTEFTKKTPFRLLCSATAAPNDYIELGTSSEALGYLGFIDMLNRYFKNDNNNSGMKRMYGEAPKWRFKGHAEQPFWQYVCSWARAIRKPSDLGFDDGAFVLPALVKEEHLVSTEFIPEGKLFSTPAANLREQRIEKRGTLKERCEQAAALVNTGKPFVIWCQFNDEGDYLQSLIPDALQVSGKDSDEVKEDRFLAFQSGQVRGLITKARIGGWGLNWQHCAHTVYFPSHSYEEFYQCVRRFWRFGQQSSVKVDIPLTEGEKLVMANLKRKSCAASAMFDALVREMRNAIGAEKRKAFDTQLEVPTWL